MSIYAEEEQQTTRFNGTDVKDLKDFAFNFNSKSKVLKHV